jgi:hypothetical protein
MHVFIVGMLGLDQRRLRVASCPMFRPQEPRQCDIALSRRLCPLLTAVSTTEERSAMLQFAAARDWRISSVG